MATPIQGRDLYRQPLGAKWRAECRESVTVMWRVIHALMLREARTRYGSSNLGYAWGLIDPVAQLAVWLLVFTALGRTSPIAVPLSAFILTGIMPLFFWRGVFSRSATAVRSNSGLINYPQVTAADVVISRILLEGATSIVVFFIITSLLDLLFDVPVSLFYSDPLQLLLALLSLLYFTTGFGFLSSGLGRIWSLWTTVTGLLSRPIYILSGVFFTLEQLPTTARRFMLYNPIAHQIEWIRSAAFESMDSQAYSILYIFWWSTIALVIGLVIDRILLLTGDEELST